VPKLADYRVRIPPGGRTGALVETVIAWEPDAKALGRATSSSAETFSTMGVDSDQLNAAVIATEKMLNSVVSRVARRTPAKRARASR
jgi:D-citramalate synthase